MHDENKYIANNNLKIIIGNMFLEQDLLKIQVLYKIWIDILCSKKVSNL